MYLRELLFAYSMFVSEAFQLQCYTIICTSLEIQIVHVLFFFYCCEIPHVRIWIWNFVDFFHFAILRLIRDYAVEICGENRRTRRKSPPNPKSLATFSMPRPRALDHTTIRAGTLMFE